MTNFEFYKEQLKEIGSIDFGMTKDGTVKHCYKMDCSDCKFYSPIEDCAVMELEFLYAEHKKQPKLTKKERSLCELYETGYISRDCNGDIGWYIDKPGKESDQRWTCCKGWDNFNQMGYSKNINFDFIKWEDEEPWSIEDLLKLEVIEE